MNAEDSCKMSKQSLEDQLKFGNKDNDDEIACKTASLEAKQDREIAELKATIGAKKYHLSSLD